MEEIKVEQQLSELDDISEQLSENLIAKSVPPMIVSKWHEDSEPELESELHWVGFPAGEGTTETLDQLVVLITKMIDVFDANRESINNSPALSHWSATDSNGNISSWSEPLPETKSQD